MANTADGAATPSLPAFSISQAFTKKDFEAVAEIWTEYTKWLDLDLTFQNYAAELTGLPGKYAPPSGALLLARDSASGEVLGCIAIRPLEISPEYRTEERKGVRFCEMKRLYTYPAARGRGVARALVREALTTAEKKGYGAVVLDTLHKMTAAFKLYTTEGFVAVEPYYHNPLSGVTFMAKTFG